MSHSQKVPIEVNRSVRNTRPMDGRLFLRDEELDAGVALILFAQKQLNRAVSQAAFQSGVSRGEAELLIAIRTKPGLTVTKMRERLAMTVPTFARVLGQIDKKALVEKHRSDRDARARLLYLNEDGLALTAPLVEAVRQALRIAYRDAGADQVAGMRAVLTSLVDGAGNG